MDDDISLLKHQVKEHDGLYSALHVELKANTVKTDAVHRDTQFLVDLFRGGKAWGAIFIGIGTILIAIATVGVWLGTHK